MLCQTAIVYGRKIDDTIYSFGHEGVLYRQSFIMYDRETNSLWVHTTGEAINGPMKGKVLTFLPSVVTSWKRWRTLHPKTTVLTGQRGSRRMGHLGLHENPQRYGISIGQGTNPKLYPFADLMARRVINDTYAGKAVVVLFDADSKTAKAYERGARAFTWKDGKLIDETGCEWDLLSGTQKKQDGARLKEIPATTWLVSRWHGFYPKGPVWQAK